MLLKKIKSLSLALVFTFTGGNLMALDVHANAKVTIKVIGEDALPIEGAKASIGFECIGKKGNGQKGLTDINGEFTAEGESDGKVSYAADKNGYYKTIEVRWLRNAKGKPEQKDGKWQPWNPTYEVVLKKIINPVPMYAKRCNLGLPKMEEKIGFDLEKADWVAPYGKGIVPDLVVFGKLDQRSPRDFDYTLTVSFSNKGDGILPFDAPYEYCSELKSSQQAPETGYQPEWIQTRSREPGKYETGNSDDKRNYYFRVRSKLDEQGNVTQAMYGKIYGDFMQFIYYFNPDGTRNVEFDPKKNLLIQPDDNPNNVKYNDCNNLQP